MVEQAALPLLAAGCTLYAVPCQARMGWRRLDVTAKSACLTNWHTSCCHDAYVRHYSTSCFPAAV